MTLPIPVGTEVRVLTGRGSCFAPDLIVTVDHHDGEDYYYCIPLDGSEGQYLYPDDVVVNDVSLITDLEEWKRAATRALFAAKAEHQWCGEAENVAREVGLDEYLPKNVTYHVTHSVTVRQWPGESDDTAENRAFSDVRGGNNASAYTISAERMG